MTENLLCIGGSKDGCTVNVIKGADTYRCIKLDEFNVTPYIKNDEPGSFETLKTETYMRELFRGENETFLMLIADGLSIDGAVSKLFSNYRPQNHDTTLDTHT